METIQMYVNNIFRNLPQTNELLAAKDAITARMLHRYEELKNQGYSEYESVGKTISELGNIEELTRGLGVTPVKQISKPSMSLEQVKSYLAASKKATKTVAIGVMLCIVGVMLTCLFSGLSEANIITILPDSDGESMLSYLSLFVCIACAVGLFIYSARLTNDYEFIKNGISIDTSTKQYIMTQKQKYKNRATTLIIIGVVLCILSPIILILTDLIPSFNDSPILCVIFLGVITTAVFLFIISSNYSSPYDRLLNESNKPVVQTKSQKLYKMVNSIIILLATAVHLILGFCLNLWESAAVIYSIGGILCAISSTIIWGVTKED